MMMMMAQNVFAHHQGLVVLSFFQASILGQLYLQMMSAAVKGSCH
jgi:hypothetical protein